MHIAFGPLAATVPHDLFSLHVPILEKVIRALLVYGFLVIALRLGGKREMGELNPLDFVVILTVANAVQNGIIGDDNTVSGAVIGATVLFTINSLMARARFSSHKFRKLVEGSPTVLIRDGIVDEAALKHERICTEDLLAAIEQQGCRDFGEVAEAILEPNGKIVAFPKTPDYETQHFLALKQQIEDLRAEIKELVPIRP